MGFEISPFPSMGNVHLLVDRQDRTGQHDYSLKESTIRQYPESISDPAIRKVVESLRDDAQMSESILVSVATHFAEQESVPCNGCGAMIWVDEWRGYYARHKCLDCDSSCSNCGADLSETKELVKSERSIRKVTIVGIDGRG